MTRYFLDLHQCGTVTEDPEGIDVHGVDAASATAVAAARDVMAGEVIAGELCLSCFIQILDVRRRLVRKVMFRDAVLVSGV